jgi:hypothetical protein
VAGGGRGGGVEDQLLQPPGWSQVMGKEDEGKEHDHALSLMQGDALLPPTHTHTYTHAQCTHHSLFIYAPLPRPRHVLGIKHDVPARHRVEKGLPRLVRIRVRTAGEGPAGGHRLWDAVADACGL